MRRVGAGGVERQVRTPWGGVFGAFGSRRRSNSCTLPELGQDQGCA